MTLRPNLAILCVAMLAVSCGQPHRRQAECSGTLETSAKLTTVQTLSGPVAGYIDDGVYIYKGIPYARLGRTSFQGSGSTAGANRSALA